MFAFMGQTDIGKRFSWTTVQLLAPRVHQTIPVKRQRPAVTMLLSMATVTVMVVLLSSVRLASALSGGLPTSPKATRRHWS